MADSEGAARASASLTDMFEGYLTPTDGDYKDVLTNGLVVPDANVLLNLYRYASSTREDLTTVLEKLGSRLWVPHQAAFEFWKNRENALNDLKKVTNETIASLDELSSQVPSIVSTWANRISLDSAKRDEIVTFVMKGFKEASNAVNNHGDLEGKNGHWDTNQDQILASLKKLLAGKVGAQLEPNEELEARTEARRRIAEKIPPGFKDAGKDDPCGDYLYWLQTLREARRRQVDVLIVTDDSRSDDWYRRPGGQTRGPRLELIREMSDTANVRLFMMRTQSLLHHATRALEVNVRPSSVKEAARLDELPEVYTKADSENQNDHDAYKDNFNRQVISYLRRKKKEEAARKRIRIEAYENRVRYEGHLASLGFAAKINMDETPWDATVVRAGQMYRLYFVDENYAKDPIVMTVIVSSAIGDESNLSASHSNDIIVTPVTPSAEVHKLMDLYKFGAVWWSEDHWEGNVIAMKKGFVF